MGFGAGYRYAHDAPGAVVDQHHLPDNLAGRRYYTPTTNGAEAAVAARLEEIRTTLAQRRSTGGDEPAPSSFPHG
jgi:putative ATPase